MDRVWIVSTGDFTSAVLYRVNTTEGWERIAATRALRFTPLTALAGGELLGERSPESPHLVMFTPHPDGVVEETTADLPFDRPLVRGAWAVTPGDAVVYSHHSVERDPLHTDLVQHLTRIGPHLSMGEPQLLSPLAPDDRYYAGAPPTVWSSLTELMRWPMPDGTILLWAFGSVAQPDGANVHQYFAQGIGPDGRFLAEIPGALVNPDLYVRWDEQIQDAGHMQAWFRYLSGGRAVARWDDEQRVGLEDRTTWIRPIEIGEVDGLTIPETVWEYRASEEPPVGVWQDGRGNAYMFVEERVPPDEWRTGFQLVGTEPGFVWDAPVFPEHCVLEDPARSGRFGGGLVTAAAAADDGLWIVFTDRYGTGTFADTFIVNLSLLHSTGELAWE